MKFCEILNLFFKIKFQSRKYFAFKLTTVVLGVVYTSETPTSTNFT